MKKIIFFDIDGTLRDEIYGVPKSTKEAIKICNQKGYYICLCTGRPIGLITEDVLELNPDGIIAGGGSYIEFHKKIIKDSYFSKKKIEEILLYLKSNNDKVAFTFETNDIVFMNEKSVDIFEKINDGKTKSLSREKKKIIQSNEKIIYENNISKFNSEISKVNKICLWANEEIYEDLKNAFLYNRFQLAQSYKSDRINYYEIIQNDCNKGDAITTLCDELNIPVSEVIAFGDGKNDIDMFKVAGTSIGVNSGDKSIFKYVNSICDSPVNDGIYLELKMRKII